MGRHYQILIPLLSLFLVRVDLTDLWPMTYQVRLIKLLDADSAYVGIGSRVLEVRFMKLDAPEMGQPFVSGAGDAGQAALLCARKVIGKQKFFTLKIYKQDIYKRILGELDDLSFRLIMAGCASIYPHAEFNSRSEKGIFIRTYFQARRLGLGLWARGGYLQPKIWRKQKRSKPKSCCQPAMNRIKK